MNKHLNSFHESIYNVCNQHIFEKNTSETRSLIEQELNSSPYSAIFNVVRHPVDQGKIVILYYWNDSDTLGTYVFGDLL